VPAVASLAVRGVVAGPARQAMVLGAATHAVWMGIGNDVVVLTSRDATRLPNSLEVPYAADAEPFSAVVGVRSARIGCGAIRVGDLTVRVARWWNPCPVLRATEATAVQQRITDITPLEPTVDAGNLRWAVRRNEPGALLRASAELLGLGGGLTPEGDDLVAGTVAGLHTLGRALGRSDVVATVETIGPPLAAMAVARTTTFSAALLRHATHGEVAAPAAGFLHALTGRGDPNVAYQALAAVGHTSGVALAAGLLLAARTLIEGDTT
jgi:hypothetical protein